MLKRSTSSIIFLFLLLFGLFTDHPVGSLLVFIIVVAATIWGTHEYYQMARRLQMRPSPWPGHLVALAFLVDAYFFQFSHFLHIFVACFWLLLITQVMFKNYSKAISNTAVSLFGSIYIGLPLAIILYIDRFPSTWGYTTPHAGGVLLMFLIATSWAMDIGGYCIGKPFGKHKMTPVLSPNKSYEGLVGGIALSILTGVLMKILWPSFGQMIGWHEAIGLPILFAGFGTIGDLAESAFKRDAGVKDSGETYTGHGGMLDVIDSLLLCAPVFYLYLEIAKNA